MMEIIRKVSVHGMFALLCIYLYSITNALTPVQIITLRFRCINAYQAFRRTLMLSHSFRTWTSALTITMPAVQIRCLFHRDSEAVTDRIILNILLVTNAYPPERSKCLLIRKDGLSFLCFSVFLYQKQQRTHEFVVFAVMSSHHIVRIIVLPFDQFISYHLHHTSDVSDEFTPYSFSDIRQLPTERQELN